MADTPTAGGGNLFTRKIGPLPMWGWVSVVGGAIVVWAMYARKKAAASQQNQQQQQAYGAAQQPPVIYQGYTTNNVNVPPNASPSGGAQTTPPVQPAPYMRPASRSQNAPLTVSYLPGGYPGGEGAAAGQQTAGAAYNFSAAQIQAMGFPNLRGLTLAQAQKALASYAGGAYHIQNESGNTAGRVTSFTPYSTGQVNLGFA